MHKKLAFQFDNILKLKIHDENIFKEYVLTYIKKILIYFWVDKYLRIKIFVCEWVIHYLF